MRPLEKLDQRVAAALQSGFFTHCYLACGSFDESTSRFEALLSKGDEREAQIFDLASLTKALVTGPLVHQFLREQQLDPMAPIGDWASQLPLRSDLLALNTAALLGHYAGLPAWWNFWMNQLDEQPRLVPQESREQRICEVLARVPLNASQQDLYSDLGYILLGALMERVGKEDLAQQFQSYKAQLACSATLIAYAPSLQVAQKDFIISAFCALRQRWLRGEVHDENCAALGGIAGHAGLFGSGPGLVHYLRALYQHPWGQSYLEANQKAWRDTQHEGLLGLRRGQGPSAEVFAEGQAIGHLGFTGTAFWLHLERRHYAVLLSNRVISGRVSPEITAFRRQVFSCFHEILN